MPEPPRRKGLKNIPKLPLSVFTPPNSGTSDRFPLPPSPSAVHPKAIVDAQVGDLKGLKERGDGAYATKCEGGVLCVKSLEDLKR